ncbi:hypothetical protein NDU88_001057 [Pleurodeles waltl]|uniref:Uncharacterized protein n=1 Tax=Pleurodeles waltl TaxID=8319 RepID=A0AAV7W0B9_PLEWA|nr:hypothetical protein NDU88_001057 [Pleurodeles waltl]
MGAQGGGTNFSKASGITPKRTPQTSGSHCNEFQAAVNTSARPAREQEEKAQSGGLSTSGGRGERDGTLREVVCGAVAKKRSRNRPQPKSLATSRAQRRGRKAGAWVALGRRGGLGVRGHPVRAASPACTLAPEVTRGPFCPERHTVGTQPQVRINSSRRKFGFFTKTFNRNPRLRCPPDCAP